MDESTPKDPTPDLIKKYFEEKTQTGKDIILKAQTDLGEMQDLKDLILNNKMYSDDDRSEIIDLIRAIQFADEKIIQSGGTYVRNTNLDLSNHLKTLEARHHGD
ncbi:MAG: hypothetical protein ABIA66_00070 [Candidatus Omnitrophota bacterium]